MIGVLTFHWADDYGALLQAYALKRRLEALAGSVEIIPYAPVKLTGRYWLCPVYARAENGKIRFRPRRYMFRDNLTLGGSFPARRRRMGDFRRKYLTAAKPVRRADRLSLEPYEAVFVGSDQVWNPDITVDLDDAYVGNIARKGTCKLISYGASVSGHAFTPEEEEKLKRCVGGGFAGISLRERGDVQRLEGLFDREVRDVLDPVLLMEASHWRTLARAPEEEGYILLYLTQPHEPLVRCAQALSARLGKKLISLSPPWYLGEAGTVEFRLDSGPQEFLGYLQNAACVLTNSFHATAFSVLLEKRFLTFRHHERNIRLHELLHGLGLGSFLVEDVPADQVFPLWERVDWEEVWRRLKEKRESSEAFIFESLDRNGSEV